MGFMNRSGYRADRLLEHTPLAKAVGFLLLGVVSRPASPGEAPSAPSLAGTAP